jgi:large subunit ribosomal protein L17
VHYRRQALAKVRDKDAVSKLFRERATEFKDRPGGYTRIYKLGTRGWKSNYSPNSLVGDAAEMALITLIAANDEGYSKPSRKPAASTEPVAEAAAPEVAVEEPKA